MEMGKLICVADPAEAAARDEALISAYDGGLTDIPPFPPFTAGIVLAGTPHAGSCSSKERWNGRASHPVRRRAGARWQLVTLGEPTIDPSSGSGSPASAGS